MSKTLSNILTVFKVLKVIAKVVFILCIVGAAGCALGLCMMPVVESLAPSGILEDGEDLLSTGYADLIATIVVCVGEAIFAFLAERYFANILRAGTPFTPEGSRECYRLGIASIIISLASAVVAGVATAVAAGLSGDASALEMDTTVSLSTGLFFLFLSLIFKHGAEVQIPANVYNASTTEGSSQGGADTNGNSDAGQSGYYDADHTELL